MDVFELIGRIAIDGADKAEKVIDSISGKSGKLGSIFGKMGSMAATGMKVAGAAIATAGTAVGGLVAKSVSAYANFEQLVGGVDTLFKESSQKVQTYADNAYKTAGLSASDYMETVTSFSASLLQSLNGDTEKAADAANMAVTDMADNMNKMGSSMESIQNAYQGFAKQNYTMLDNLKLGYGGTKNEMERLLEDAQKLSGVEYDIENLNDVYSAIHVIQTELGITGTTAKEAEETISGSFASMKSALDNFITGLGDENADMDKLFGNLIDSADVFLNNNLIPTVERILNTVIDRLPQFLPKVLEAIGGLIESISAELPSFIEKMWELFDTEVLQNIPQLMSKITDIIVDFINTLPNILSTILPKIARLFDDIVSNLPENLSRIGAAITNKLPEILTQIFNSLISMIKSLANNAGEIANICYTLMHKVSEAVRQALPGLISEIIAALPDVLMGLIEMIVEYFADVPKRIGDKINLLLGIFEGIWEGIKRIFAPVVNWFKNIFGNAADGIRASWGGITTFFSGIWDGIKSAFSGVASFFSDAFGSAVDGVKWVFDKLFGWISSATEGVKSLLETIGLLNDGVDTSVVSPGVGTLVKTKSYTGSINSYSDAKMAGHAKGGIVTREHIARVGEDGAEAIIPLERNTEWIDRVAERIGGSGGGSSFNDDFYPITEAEIDEITGGDEE